MKVPASVVKEIEDMAFWYIGDQKAWYHRNIGRLLANVQYQPSKVVKRYGANCSQCHPLEGRYDGYTVLLLAYNRGYKQTDRQIAETFWHEEGHFLFNKIPSCKSFLKFLQDELMTNVMNRPDLAGKSAVEIAAISKAEGLGPIAEQQLLGMRVRKMPIMASDALGILLQYQFKGFSCHEVGYSANHLETEVFAEFFSYLMSNDREALNTFQLMCPKTSALLEWKIRKIFK